MTTLPAIAELVKEATAQWNELEAAVLKEFFSLHRSGAQAGLKVAYSRLCMNHAKNAALLFDAGENSSARALIRPALDAYGRQLIITFEFTQSECEEIWQEIQNMADAVRSGQHESASRIDSRAGKQLPYGHKLVGRVMALKLPRCVPFAMDFKNLFDVFNSATHGGLSAAAMLLTHEDGVPREPDLCADHYSYQLSSIALRAMSLMALLASEDGIVDAERVHVIYQRIVGDAKSALRNAYAQ